MLLKLFVVLLFFFLGWQGNVYYETKIKIKIIKEIKTTLFQKIKEKKRLDVLILNSPTVYYIGDDRELGFEYELISAYAKDIGVDLNLTIVYTINEALQKTREGLGDITVSSITLTEDRNKEFTFGPQYYSTREQLICSNALYRKKTMPRDYEDLIGLNIVVGKDTSYERTLNKLVEEIDGFGFNVSETYSTEELFELVQNDTIDCTVSDANLFTINQRFYPKLVKTLVLGERKNLAWILRKGDNSLNDSLLKWLNTYERSGKMEELKDFYYSYFGLFDYYDNMIFTKRIKNRLPKYIKHFKEAGNKYNIPWILLASLSYQESHWNPKAKSHTGVRGMMMITRATAKHLGVKNRLNAKESIYGGAKYLRELEKRFSPKIKGKNRWAFTLAAYNVGMGHIHDAQTLARKLNKNPYSWKDIKRILPLLTQKKYYKNLKYGYARGNEPVAYVDSIQGYINILVKNSSD